MFKISTKGFAEMRFSRRSVRLNATILDDSSFRGGFFGNDRMLHFLGFLRLRLLARGSILQEDDNHDL